MGEAQRFVWLNGVQLPIEGKVALERITPFAEQIRTSAPGVDDYTPTSKQEWAKLKGGLGVDKWTPEEKDRYWQAEGVDASINLQSLGPLVTTLGSFGAIPLRLIKFEDKIWAIGHNQISYWDGSAWQSVKTDFPNPTDSTTWFGTS